MSLALARGGCRVHGVDICQDANAIIRSGNMPFMEEGCEMLLREVLDSGAFSIGNDPSVMALADYVVVMVGTPIDDDFAPRMEGFNQVIGDVLTHLRMGQTVIISSTVHPGTTDRVKARLEAETGLREGADFHLAYIPRREVEGHFLSEVTAYPVIVGAYNAYGFAAARNFCAKVTKQECLWLSPPEAEFGKLACNMARYVSFALANEFHALAAMHSGIRIHQVIDAFSQGYPRLNLPKPGANVGGPCLRKDGFFLSPDGTLPPIVQAAHVTNESIPAWLADGLARYPGIKRVGVLGTTFKADSDDVRHSLYPKLADALRKHGFRVVAHDPYDQSTGNIAGIRGVDAVILMTPHAAFRDIEWVRDAVDNDACIYVDMWGFWPHTRAAGNGGFATLE